MKGFTSTLAAVAFTSGALAALPAITVKGNAFYKGSDRFYIRGVDYQPGTCGHELVCSHRDNH